MARLVGIPAARRRQGELEEQARYSPPTSFMLDSKPRFPSAIPIRLLCFTLSARLYRLGLPILFFLNERRKLIRLLPFYGARERALSGYLRTT